jgi:hypothetical protein
MAPPSRLSHRSGSMAPILLAGLALGNFHALAAQAGPSPWPTWHAELWSQPLARQWTPGVDGRPAGTATSQTHSHTLTGLLIGGVVGAAATGVFLAGFCSDPDTQCGADEVGRAVLIIGVPPALLGALIGSLIRTED